LVQLFIVGNHTVTSIMGWGVPSRFREKNVEHCVYVLLSYRIGYPENISLVEQPAGIVLKYLKVRGCKVRRRKSRCHHR